MTNVVALQEERGNRFNRILEDERGLTMVELLATVVILAIIMGIGAVAIGQVIQNSKEDAAVSEVQSAYTAAKLYLASSVGSGKETFKLSELTTSHYFEVGNSDVWGAAGAADETAAAAAVVASQDLVVFKVSADGTLTMTVGNSAVTAGKKKNTDATAKTTNLNSTAVAKLNRDSMTFKE